MAVNISQDGKSFDVHVTFEGEFESMRLIIKRAQDELNHALDGERHRAERESLIAKMDESIAKAPVAKTQIVLKEREKPE